MSHSATRSRSDNLFEKWYTAIKDAFGVGSGATDVAPTTGRVSRGRLATLRKTYEAVGTQSPEIAMRPLQDIASALGVEEMLAADAGEQPVREVQDLKRDVMAAIETCNVRAREVSQAHLTDWQQGMNTLPAAGATGDSRAARADAIQKLLARIEPGVARDTYMLKQIDRQAAVGTLEALQLMASKAEELKEALKALRPKPNPDAGEPTRLPEVARPAIKGDLTEQDQNDLARAMKETQAAMGADRQTDPATVKAAVALIAKGIDVKDAHAAMVELGTWDKVKEHYRSLLKAGRGDEAKAFMARMWWFRRMTVDGEMTRLQEKYDFIWGSVGSDNPESDYDLTVRTHPAKPTDDVKWDYQIVQLANTALTAPFGGKPPGIVFDTNLYAEAAAKPQALSDDQKRSPAIQAMGAMKEQGQDVGALMKLRRFMEWDEYEDYKAAMLNGMADAADRVLVQRQFDEADSLFLIARAEQLREAAKLLPAQERGKQEDKISKLENSPDGQRELLAMAAELEHDPATSMAANNALYTEKLTAVRNLEAEYDAATDATAKAGLLARLKSLQADATFFAAEAYHSEGPLQHVVKAGQSSRLEIAGNGVAYVDDMAKNKAIDELKTKKLEALSANQMLQSFNENLGDLLKDLRHYAAESFPGLGFYRSSKYIERLCDAASIIKPKLPEALQTKFEALTFGGRTPDQVRTSVAKLVDIRGEKSGFLPRMGAEFDPEAEKQAFAMQQMDSIFPGVVTLPDLAKVASTFGQQVNALVRTAITKDMRAAQENPYFPKDGKA